MKVVFAVVSLLLLAATASARLIQHHPSHQHPHQHLQHQHQHQHPQQQKQKHQHSLVKEAKQLEEDDELACGRLGGQCSIVSNPANCHKYVPYSIYDETGTCTNAKKKCCVPQCYIDYKKIISNASPKAIVERDAAQEGPRYAMAKICKKSKADVENECEEEIELKVDEGCKVPLQDFAGELLRDAHTTLWEDGFADEFMSNFLRNLRGGVGGCWYGIQAYGTHGQRVFRYNIFNCFMRNSYHLKALVPKQYYWVRDMITQELEVYGEKRPSLIYDSPVYRGAFCLPLEENTKMMSVSFLSTSKIVLTNFAKNKCVYVFYLDNDFGFKPVEPEHLNWNASEQEILLPPGLCFNVLNVESDRDNFVPDAQPEDLNIQKQFDIGIIRCTDEIKSSALLI